MRHMSVLVLLLLLLGKTDIVNPHQEREIFYAWALEQPAHVDVKVRYNFALISAMLDERFLFPNQRWVTMEVSAYNSVPGQTDDSPFITANNTRVRWGIVATNILPFNTVVRIPALYGDMEFVVTDRMNTRYGVDGEKWNGYLDVWMEEVPKAWAFGRNHDILVEIVRNPNTDTI